MDTLSYHLDRELAEIRMSAEAESSVARIVHDKLAVLHHSSAAQAAKAIALAAEGEMPPLLAADL
jgi:hypothetical protein